MSRSWSPAAQRPALPAPELLCRQLDRNGVGLTGHGVRHALAGVRRPQCLGQPAEVAPVGRGHDRHRSGGRAVAPDRLGRGPDEDVVDLVGVEPAEHGEASRVEVLETLRGGGGPVVDAGRASSEQHALRFAGESPSPARLAPRREFDQSDRHPPRGSICCRDGSRNPDGAVRGAARVRTRGDRVSQRREAISRARQRCRRRSQLHRLAGRDLRAHRPVGLRQDDRAEDGQPPDLDLGRRHHDRRHERQGPRAHPAAPAASATSFSRSACSPT